MDILLLIVVLILVMLLNIINYYTKEAGVRELERVLSTVMRKVARKILDKETDKVIITKDNIRELEFLSLMSIIDKYSELSGLEYRNKLREYVNKVGINFIIVKEYISLFPAIVYKNIYEGGLMRELL